MPYCKNCGNELQPEAKFCPRCGASVTTSEQSASASVTPPITSGLKFAYWGERFVAWLIDVLILGLIVGLLGLFSWFASGSFTWWSNWPGWVPFFNFNLSGAIYFLYWLFMDGVYGQSLGKMIMHIRVVRLDGGRIGFGKAALESLGKAFLLPLDILLGWISSLREGSGFSTTSLKQWLFEIDAIIEETFYWQLGFSAKLFILKSEINRGG